jgi:hypothetical protein
MKMLFSDGMVTVIDCADPDFAVEFVVDLLLACCRSQPVCSDLQ